MFEKIKARPEDPIDINMRFFSADENPKKVDVGVGVYLDDTGKPPLMKAVAIAEQRLVDKKQSKEYKTPAGNLDYCDLQEQLIFGVQHGRSIVSIQTPGGGPALKAACELIKRWSPEARIWVPNPTWHHQHLVINSAALDTLEYPYYRLGERDILREQLFDTLEKDSRVGDVLLLHGCCHNPTGQDLTLEDWQHIAALCGRKGLVPLVDFAYQGMGLGIQDDAEGMQQLIKTVPEVMVSSTSSKSFGIYRERAGMFSVISNASQHQLTSIRKEMLDITRGLYFMSADYGAALVVEILSDPELERLWRAELNSIRERMNQMRSQLADGLLRHLGDDRCEFIRDQIGMFSILPLDDTHVVKLREKHSVYLIPGGRINMAGMTRDNIDYVIECLVAALR